MAFLQDMPILFVLLVTSLISPITGTPVLEKRDLSDLTSAGSPDLIFGPDSVPVITNSLNATAFALVYGEPLINYANFILPSIASVGVNAPDNEATTATATGAAVIRPNVDTLYSRVAVDLSKTDVAITVPPIDDGRFYVFPFYDIYSDNIADIGSVSKSLPGQYLMRLVDAEHPDPGLTLSNDPNCKYRGFVNFPTVYGYLLIRILLRNNLTDLPIVHRYQSKISFSPVHRPWTPIAFRGAPPLSTNLLNDSLPADDVGKILELTARLSRWNPPELHSVKRNVTYNLEKAGVFDGFYIKPQDVNYTQAVINAAFAVSADLYQPQHRFSFGNNWTQLLLATSGNFYKDYAARTYITSGSLGELLPYEAIYPEYIGEDKTAVLFLGPNEASILAFSAKPPVTGFWSVTMYGSDNYLVPNVENTYALGDRSNLTYADGTLVYASSTSNGPFQILIQPSNVQPPANWTSNWLPAPSGGGDFSLNLRFYGPSSAFTDGAYVFPVLTNHTALV